MAQETFSQRYTPDYINRAYFLADALIYMNSYTGKEIDAAAAAVTNEDIKSFCKVVAMLNKIKSGERLDGGK